MMSNRLIFILLALTILFYCRTSLAQSELYVQPLTSSADHVKEELLRQNLSNAYSNTWNVGSAKKLEGNIYLLEVWLTEEGTSWKYNEMCNIHSSISAATQWITNVAAKYNKRIKFNFGSFSGSNFEGIQMKYLPKSYEDCATMPQLLPKVLKNLGYASIFQCYNQFIKDYHNDNVVVLVIINNDGWSCANNFSIGHINYGYQQYFLENAYIFKTSGGEPTSSPEIAHEMLHLFGAWDMYEGQVDSTSAKWAANNFPNEIMFQVHKPINECMISPLTAWLLGLSDKFESWFWNFVRIED